MERFCISLGQAKRLKEFGFDRGSIHVWFEVDSADKGTLVFFDEIPSFLDHRPRLMYWAYSVGELGEFLPDHITTEEGVYYLNTVKYKGAGWAIVYQSDNNSYLVRADEDTEAQARGALLIYLLESNLLL